MKPLHQGVVFFVLLLIGLIIFYVSVLGFVTTPFYDFDNGIWRCFDWGFHACYAESLDLSKANAWVNGFEQGMGGYSYYPPVIHLFAHYASLLSGLPVVFWLAALVSACFMFLALLLLARSGFPGFLNYFVVLPFVLIAVLGFAPGTWFDVAGCGTIPFLIACSLFCLLVTEYGEFSFKWYFVLFALMLFVHNYGWVLNFFLIIALAFAWFLTRNIKNASFIVILITFVWLIGFSSVIFPNNSGRIVFVFFFFVCLESGKRLNKFFGG